MEPSSAPLVSSPESAAEAPAGVMPPPSPPHSPPSPKNASAGAAIDTISDVGASDHQSLVSGVSSTSASSSNTGRSARSSGPSPPRPSATSSSESSGISLGRSRALSAATNRSSKSLTGSISSPQPNAGQIVSQSTVPSPPTLSPRPSSSSIHAERFSTVFRRPSSNSMGAASVSGPTSPQILSSALSNSSEARLDVEGDEFYAVGYSGVRKPMPWFLELKTSLSKMIPPVSSATAGSQPPSRAVTMVYVPSPATSPTPNDDPVTPTSPVAQSAPADASSVPSLLLNRRNLAPSRKASGELLAVNAASSITKTPSDPGRPPAAPAPIVDSDHTNMSYQTPANTQDLQPSLGSHQPAKSPPGPTSSSLRTIAAVEPPGVGELGSGSLDSPRSLATASSPSAEQAPKRRIDFSFWKGMAGATASHSRNSSTSSLSRSNSLDLKDRRETRGKMPGEGNAGPSGDHPRQTDAEGSPRTSTEQAGLWRSNSMKMRFKKRWGGATDPAETLEAQLVETAGVDTATVPVRIISSVTPDCSVCDGTQFLADGTVCTHCSGGDSRRMSAPRHSFDMVGGAAAEDRPEDVPLPDRLKNMGLADAAKRTGSRIARAVGQLRQRRSVEFHPDAEGTPGLESSGSDTSSALVVSPPVSPPTSAMTLFRTLSLTSRKKPNPTSPTMPASTLTRRPTVPAPSVSSAVGRSKSPDPSGGVGGSARAALKRMQSQLGMSSRPATPKNSTDLDVRQQNDAQPSHAIATSITGSRSKSAEASLAGSNGNRSAPQIPPRSASIAAVALVQRDHSNSTPSPLPPLPPVPSLTTTRSRSRMDTPSPRAASASNSAPLPNSLLKSAAASPIAPPRVSSTNSHSSSLISRSVSHPSTIATDAGPSPPLVNKALPAEPWQPMSPTPSTSTSVSGTTLVPPASAVKTSAVPVTSRVDRTDSAVHVASPPAAPAPASSLNSGGELNSGGDLNPQQQQQQVVEIVDDGDVYYFFEEGGDNLLVVVGEGDEVTSSRVGGGKGLQSAS
ncbi:hypothetical protein DFJ73DRAFT_819996 [Zopfochytrium polystomum]|nr:hypothetical protein DFJ73DRAFT_819996 [Zopfochytrium polystomum]